MSGVLSALSGSFAAAGGGITPADLTGVKFWMEGDVVTGPVDGETLSPYAWNDQGPDGVEFSGTAIYKTVGVPFPLFRFNGSDTQLTSGTGATVSDFHAFAVVEQTGDAGIFGSTSTPFVQLRIGNPSANILSAEPGGATSSTLAVTEGNFSLLHWARTGTTVTFRQNSSSYGTGTMSGDIGINEIGGLLGANNVLNGDLAAVLLVDHELTTELAGIVSYFMTKYGL